MTSFISRPLIWALGLGMLLLTSVGCGPVESTAVLMDADARLAAARAAHAEQHAPYEFEAARAYLDKAREEQGYSDFEAAIDYGNKSIELSTRAVTISQKQKGER